jgi:hypothetical protein
MDGLPLRNVASRIRTVGGLQRNNDTWQRLGGQTSRKLPGTVVTFVPLGSHFPGGFSGGAPKNNNKRCQNGGKLKCGTVNPGREPGFLCFQGTGEQSEDKTNRILGDLGSSFGGKS